MENVISVQDAMAKLNVNRASFYTRCKKSGVKPVRQGRRSFITQEELECLGSVCTENVWQTSGLDRQQTDNRQTTDTSDKSSNGDLRLIEALNTEIAHLKLMLSEERDDHRKEKTEVVKERENYQKMLMFLQQDNQALRQQLLEAPKSSGFDVDAAAEDIQDSVDISPPSPAASAAQPMEYASRSSSWGLGIGLGAVSAAAMLYMVVASEHGSNWFPSLQDKVRGALQLTDSGSIVPYRYENGGLR